MWTDQWGRKTAFQLAASFAGFGLSEQCPSDGKGDRESHLTGSQSIGIFRCFCLAFWVHSALFLNQSWSNDSPREGNVLYLGEHHSNSEGTQATAWEWGSEITAPWLTSSYPGWGSQWQGLIPVLRPPHCFGYWHMRWCKLVNNSVWASVPSEISALPAESWESVWMQSQTLLPASHNTAEKLNVQRDNGQIGHTK